jgi:hypothetical protein
MLHSDLKIFAQLFECILSLSGEVAPVVHGNNFSPGRSLSNSGTNIIKTTVRESEKTAVKKP